jgi:hypothetical protein
VRLATLLKLNGRDGKVGAGCDAPYLWANGRIAQLERYCQRDTEALAELVTQAWIKVPGGGGTAAAAITPYLTKGRDGAQSATEAAEVGGARSGTEEDGDTDEGSDRDEDAAAGGEEHGTEGGNGGGARRRDLDTDAGGGKRQRRERDDGGNYTTGTRGRAKRSAPRGAANDGEGATPRTAAGKAPRALREIELTESAREGRWARIPEERRKRGAPLSYDEYRRRAKRRRTHGVTIRHVARGKRGRTSLALTTEVGPLTVERIVAGRYEWRDAGMREMTGKRRQLWLGTRTWDPGD